MRLFRGAQRRGRPADTGIDMYALRNRTAKRIAIRSVNQADPELIIPPFGQRVLTASEVEGYAYQDWTRQRLVRKEQVTGTGSTASSRADLVSFVAGWAVLAGLVSGTLAVNNHSAAYAVLAVASALVVAACWLGGWWISKNSGAGEVASRMARSINIFLVVVVGAGLSIGEIFWQQERTGYAFGANASLLLFLLPAASILPAALFFWFHRQKMPVVREGFLRDIVRLDPNVQTIDDAETAYSGLIDDVYGPDPRAATSGQIRIAGAAWGGLPIVITTLLFAVLWNWALLSPMERSADNLLHHRRTALDSLSRDVRDDIRPYDPSDGPLPVPGYTEAPLNTSGLLTPDAGVVTFAFLGSYFFALNMLFRRYTRSDLTPKAYTHVCMRLITAIVVAWVVSRIPSLRTGTGDPDALMLLLAFVIGVVPETGTAVIQDVLRKTPGLGKAVPSLREDHPLAKLDGISLYDRSQLLEVGIENVESLAHNNLIELRLWTRIPTSRLVDFVDQAVLYLHVRGAARLDDPRAVKDGDEGALALLGAYGIRTATDLERAHDAATQRGAESQLLGLLGGDGVPRLRVVLDALADDEWMVHLRNWRSSSLPHPPLRSVEELVGQAATESQAVDGAAGDGARGALSPGAAPGRALPTR